MKRIVQVVHDFLPRHPHGTENYTYHLSKELQKIGKVYIFCWERKGLFSKNICKDELFDGLPIRRLHYGTPSTFEATYQNHFMDREFERFLDVINPDIVHFQHLIRLSASMVEVAKQRRIPTILTLHDFWFLCPQIQLLTNDNRICSGPDSNAKCANCEKIFYAYGRYLPEPLNTLKRLVPSGFRRALKEKFLRTHATTASVTSDMIARRSRFLRDILYKVDIVLAPSKFLIRKFIDYGIAKDRIAHLDYGIDHGALVNFIKQRSNRFRFGFVGGLSEHKGIRVLIEAFNKIKRDKVSLSIFGPCHQSYLRKLKRELKIDSRTIFFGPFDHRQISSVFSKIDVLVYPSIWYENQPFAILEALLAKIPVIASNLGGMAELLQDGVTGLLFEAGNPDDLSQKMVSLIDSPQLQRKLSETPSEVKTIEKNAEELNEIYDSLLKKIAHPLPTAFRFRDGAG